MWLLPTPHTPHPIASLPSVRAFRNLKCIPLTHIEIFLWDFSLYNLIITYIFFCKLFLFTGYRGSNSLRLSVLRVHCALLLLSGILFLLFSFFCFCVIFFLVFYVLFCFVFFLLPGILKCGCAVTILALMGIQIVPSLSHTDTEYVWPSAVGVQKKGREVFK